MKRKLLPWWKCHQLVKNSNRQFKPVKTNAEFDLVKADTGSGEKSDASS